MRLLAYLNIIQCERELTLPDGTRLPPGTQVLLLPQTTAENVLVGETSLAEHLAGLAPAAHGHEDLETALAGFQTQCARLAERVTALELSRAAAPQSPTEEVRP
ncbi:hypothetical protein [uncultured Desulfovibrio sp.]|uniref:hypothetical protein n=1 Tax=uncultured Desulfovibrio sp. TaxID=167968 RepID=UPI0026065CD0|nr:hypothetical protein [uncultured Desulfovibrio sp.]